MIFMMRKIVRLHKHLSNHVIIPNKYQYNVEPLNLVESLKKKNEAANGQHNCVYFRF